MTHIPHALMKSPDDDQSILVTGSKLTEVGIPSRTSIMVRKQREREKLSIQSKNKEKCSVKSNIRKNCLTAPE